MTIPDYQSLMLPVLRQSASGEVRVSEVVDRLAQELKLTDGERTELLPSGKQTWFANKVHWAKTYLKQAGLVDTTRRGFFQISKRGLEVLSSGVDRIDVNYLNQFEEFVDFRERSSTNETQIEASTPNNTARKSPDLTPDEMMRTAFGIINGALGTEIIDRILTAPPSFFERVIVDLLVAMGYGGTASDAGRAIGKSGDHRVDGVIDQDLLGLDRVYVQAKRYNRDNGVGAGAIRDFFGSLDMHKASKGLFVTTSTFSKSALETAEKLGKRIVLIDGRALAQLMIRFNVGCRVEENFEIKRIDEEFFE
jgi:restriction system protein